MFKEQQKQGLKWELNDDGGQNREIERGIKNARKKGQQHRRKKGGSENERVV